MKRASTHQERCRVMANWTALDTEQHRLVCNSRDSKFTKLMELKLYFSNVSKIKWE